MHTDKPLSTATTLLPRYQELLPILRRIAHANGYAIGLHGSGQRDLDLIAVPWTAEAVTAEELVERLVEACEGTNRAGVLEPGIAERPHGRRSWSIMLSGSQLFYEHPYIDLSVMPLGLVAAPPRGLTALAATNVSQIRQLLLEAVGMVGLHYGLRDETYQVGDPMPAPVAEFALRAKAMLESLDAAAQPGDPE